MQVGMTKFAEFCAGNPSERDGIISDREYDGNDGNGYETGEKNPAAGTTMQGL